MNPICRNEFDKAKDLIRLRKESMGNYVKPKVQNLDSGILLQFFENWEDTVVNYGGKDINLKKRVFDVLNHKKIYDVTMYFADDLQVRYYQLSHNILYLNLDGSFDFVVDDDVIHMKPFSVATFKKGTNLSVQNIDVLNYIICVRFDSPIF